MGELRLVRVIARFVVLVAQIICLGRSELVSRKTQFHALHLGTFMEKESPKRSNTPIHPIFLRTF